MFLALYSEKLCVFFLQRAQSELVFLPEASHRTQFDVSDVDSCR